MPADDALRRRVDDGEPISKIAAELGLSGGAAMARAYPRGAPMLTVADRMRRTAEWKRRNGYAWKSYIAVACDEGRIDSTDYPDDVADALGVRI